MLKIGTSGCVGEKSMVVKLDEKGKVAMEAGMIARPCTSLA